MFDFEKIKGLSQDVAREKLKSHGYNELQNKKDKSVLLMVTSIIKEPMILLLLGGGLIYFLLGDPNEALILISLVFIVIGITFYQERKTERALEALKELSTPIANVVRDGKEMRVPGREVVPDDVILISEGERIPADGFLIYSSNLEIDESMLTGESLPVAKKSSEQMIETMSRPGGEDSHFIYSGTLVIQGHGLARIISTGEETEIGKIGKTLQTITHENTRFQVEVNNIVKTFTIYGFCLATLVIILYVTTRGSLLKGILAGITLMMSLLPEEFPVVLIIFLTLGAWRISKKSVLTRNSKTIETLGSATVLCVDKTGTITMNKISLKNLWTMQGEYAFEETKKSLPEKFHELLEFSVLASQKEPHDPLEKSIRQIGSEKLVDTKHLHNNWVLEHEYPLSKNLFALSHVWKSPDIGKHTVASKGAPEAIIELCKLSKKEKDKILEQIEKMALQGLRILGVARAEFDKDKLPESQKGFNFEFIGLIGFQDPIRSDVPNVVKECYGAGIRLIMITGDYPVTASNIAREIGLKNYQEILTGKELDELSDQDLLEKIKSVNVFARVVPDQKLRIVKALQQNKEIVAMTGDGVNDAPALKEADIGIAMGSRGTDVAREASDLILLNDDFPSIVHAIRLGRRIYDNLNNAMSYILSVHVPIAGLSVFPLVFNWPLILMPVHIAFLELIIDPACSTVFEAEHSHKDIMTRPPRKQNEPLMGATTILYSILQGFGILLILGAIYAWSLNTGFNGNESRTLIFTCLVLSNIVLILSNRSKRMNIFKILMLPNKTFWVLTSLVIIVLFSIVYFPFLQNLFKFSSLKPEDIRIPIISTVFTLAWVEFLKITARKNI